MYNQFRESLICSSSLSSFLNLVDGAEYLWFEDYAESVDRLLKLVSRCGKENLDFI